MKTVIYYFTGTGNSLSLAKKLSEKIGNCDLIPVAKALANKEFSCDYEKVGFVFPVYFHGNPLIVNEFIEKLEIKKESYLFAVVNMGGSPNLCDDITNEVLSKKDMKLNAFFQLRMVSNYISYFQPIKESKMAKVFDEADKKLNEIAEIVSNKDCKIENSFFLFKLFFSIFYKFFKKKARICDKKYKIEEQCNGCGTCAKVCPVNNIEMKEGKPTFNNRCEQCYACINLCPKEAIQIGFSKSKKRYKHPEISIKEIIEQK
jgi:ferredoxin